VRVEANDPDYADKNPFVINWIDTEDAIPGRSLRMMDVNELKDMDAQFASLMKAGVPAKAKSKVKPKGRPKGSKSKAKTKTPPEPTTAASPEPPESPTSKTPPPAPGDEDEDSTIKGHCTKHEAWCAVVEMRDPKIDDDTLKEVWLGNIDEVCGEGATDEQDKITDEQWFAVKELTQKETAIF